MKTIAIIPARGGSKRLPGKNVRKFLGMPLIEWSIRFAKKIDRFDRVIISTDSREIAEVSRAAGADVPYLRPAELASDDASSADVVLDVLRRESEEGRNYDLVALLQPTSPIRDKSRWDEAFGLIMQHDAVIGAAPVKHCTSNSSRIIGNLYLIWVNALKKHKMFAPPDTAYVLCDGPCEGFDIDTEDEWDAAVLAAKRQAYVSVFGTGTP